MQLIHDVFTLYGERLAVLNIGWWAVIIAMSVLVAILAFQRTSSTYMGMYTGIMLFCWSMVLLVLSPPLWVTLVVLFVLSIGLFGRMWWVMSSGSPTPRLKKRQWVNLWNELLDRAHL